MNTGIWPKITQVRDLSIIELDDSQRILVACDSIGAVGAKELDALQVPYFIVGRCAARVPLLELLAVGARPVLISDCLTLEMEPSGREILAGIQHELKLLGLEGKCHLTGSTEENFVTRQSGIGITVVALAGKEELRIGKVRPGHEIYCFGIPKVGAEVDLDDPDIISFNTVVKLLQYPQVHEMAPVGSKGIRYEAELLTRSCGGRLQVDSRCPLPLTKSAGPATCLVAAVEPGSGETLYRDFSLPITYIGRIVG
ncbi:MAG TPA: alpha-ribazole kinase [Clostridia bacterium]|nr:alpha-ribazole kinase [Clostridia bacterium]